ncbi:MAG: efflux RND transporter periplasmic adaptor subunit [Marinifilaceae bacterium]|jgi:HlyD family secretion protein|nr:efflux RND transporter periplasmic adaptor subunit [Marinifilaceae bacterium]
MKKIIRILVISLIVVAFIGTIAFLYQKSKPVPKIYSTQSPEIKDIAKKTVATGSVVPRKEIEIKPQGVSGIIEKIYVEAGNIVKKGDAIAKIKIIPDMINLNAAESRVEKASANYDNVKIRYDRDKALFEKKVISESDFLRVQVEYRNADIELQSAKDNLEIIKKGVSKKSATATNTIIRSTIQGMILDIPVKEGYSVIQSNTFNAGTTVAIVADMGEMIFQGKVDETEVDKIELGMILDLTIGAIEDTKFKAKLEYISPKGTVENGAIQFEIKASVKLKNDFFIRSGYSANAEIVLDKREKVLAINEMLLEFRNDSTFVEVETDKKQVFEEKYVKTGISDGINIEIIEGLDIKDKIKGRLQSDLDKVKEEKKKKDQKKNSKKNKKS